MNRENPGKLVVFLACFLAAWAAVSQRHSPIVTPPVPDVQVSDIEAAAAGAIKLYASGMHDSHKQAAEKLRSGELKSLDEAFNFLGPINAAHRKDAFRPVGVLVDQTPEENVEAAAKVLEEAATGYGRAANAIK